MTRANYSLSRDHPLLGHNPHNCVLYMDEYFSVEQASKIEEQPSPRLLNTHLPYSLLPDSIKSSQCRIIYVCREPKDVLVSWWHFCTAIWSYKKEANSTISFAKALDLFCNGRTHFGPLWDHVLEYWRESLQRPDKVLFLKYEEILKEPVEKVRRLAEFIGCPFSPEEEKEGVVEDIIQLCSFERLSKTEANKTGNQASIYEFPNSMYFRKGEIGDWANHMSLEMAQRLDQVIKEKIKGTGLTLGGVCLDADTSSNI